MRTVAENKKNRKSLPLATYSFLFVRMKGLEPPRLAAPDPKSGAAANYATSACPYLGMANICIFKLQKNSL